MDFEILRKHLLQADGLERACFALLGRRMPNRASEGIDELYVHRLLLPTDQDYAERHATAVEPSPEFVLETFSQFARSGVPGYLHAHSHPFSDHARFSAIDDWYFPGMQQSLRNYFRVTHYEREKYLLFIRLVYGRLEEGFQAEGVDAEGRLVVEISELRVVGPRGIRTIPTQRLERKLGYRGARDSELLGGLLERNVRFLGEAGQRQLLQTHLVVCGAGGLGSFVLAQAKGLGFRKITIIDPDSVEETNLNRLIGATRQDIGRPKVEVLAQELQRYDPQIVVRPLRTQVQDEVARRAIVAGDVVVNCLDNDAARLEVQVLAARHLKPLLDLGSGIMLDSDRQSIAEMGGQAIFYAPGGPCLVCQGLDPAQIISEQIRAIQRAAGYIAGTDETPPSAVVLNAVIAGLGMDMLVKYLTGFARTPTYLRYDLLKHQTLYMNFAKRPECPICGQNGVEGKGEELAKPLECSARLTKAIPTPRRQAHMPAMIGRVRRAARSLDGTKAFMKKICLCVKRRTKRSQAEGARLEADGNREEHLWNPPR